MTHFASTGKVSVMITSWSAHELHKRALSSRLFSHSQTTFPIILCPDSSPVAITCISSPHQSRIIRMAHTHTLISLVIECWLAFTCFPVFLVSLFFLTQGCIPESTVNLLSAKPWTFGWLTPNLAYSRYVVPKMRLGVSSFNSENVPG